MKFACPSCAGVFSADESYAGTVRTCPSCQTDFRLPDADEPRRARRFSDDDSDRDHPRPRYGEPSKRITAGVLAIFLGGFGVHKFYLGYTQAGLIHLVLLFCTCGLMKIIGLIEAIIYLTKSDEEFRQMYQVNKKEWF